MNRLLSDELSYDLQIRGAPADGTVLKRHQRLSGLLRLEKLGTVGYREPSASDDPVRVQEEVDTCTGKITELGAAIQSFDVHNTSNEYRRMQSRLLHVIGRLGRLPDSCASKSELLSRGSQLLGSLGELVAQPPQDHHSNQTPRTTSGQLLVLDDQNPMLSQHILDDPKALLPQVVHSASRSRESVRNDRSPGDEAVTYGFFRSICTC